MTEAPRAIRWGILGAGRVSAAFTHDLLVAGHTVSAVGARSGASAREFAERFDVSRAHQGYDALVGDEQVDIVYVATPQGLHEEHALLAFAAGKPVLVEKSFTLDGPSAQRVADAAQAAGVFAMEAMWTRFVPTAVTMRRLLADGAIGEVRSVTTAHHQAIRPRAGSRHLDPALGGGALIDLGVYGVSFAVGLLGEVRRIEALGHAVEGVPGIDAEATVLLEHVRGLSTTQFSMVHAGPSRGSVVGSEGYLELDPYWFTWTGISRYDGGRPAELRERVEPGPVPRALHFQAAEAERCLREGLLESPVMPLEESVAVMHTLDRIRASLELTRGDTAG